MATSLGKLFFNNKKATSQYDGETPGSTAETLVIRFDQEKFKQLLFEDDSIPTSAHKHKKISMARSPLAIARKQVPDKTEKAVSWPNSASTKTALASLQRLQARR